jgi:glycopeptide antibiotics resistance protein
MSTWTWSAEIGVLFGVVAFSLIFFPVVALQYRRFGRFTALRLLGAAAVSIYLTTLAAYTLLPLPSSQGRECEPQIQLVPFHFLSDIATDTAGDGVLATLASPAMLQVVFNVLLFMPLGIIARGFYSRGLASTVLIGVAASVFIEATQYTAIWGLYRCSYRLADVDDVLTNTLGMLLGGLLAPLVLSWMPRERALRATRGTPRPVTARRRWLGMAIDLALLHIIGGALDIAYRIVLLATVGDGPDRPDAVDAALGALVPALLVFIVPAARRTGASLGQTAVWLVPQWPRPVSAARRMLRAASVGGLYGALLFVSRLDLPVAAPVAGGIAALLLVAAAVAVPLTREAAGLSGLLTGAVMRDERETRPAPAAAART